MKQLRTIIGIIIGKIRGIHYTSPNYLFYKSFSPSSSIVDVGCGFDADFSFFMINHYGVTAIGLDPTHKHLNSLTELVKKSGGKFRHYPVAISATDGTITFNESVENVSGSILQDHKNIQRDHTRTYEVTSIGLSKLPAYLNLPRIEYIKLDLEGAEYQLIEELQKSDVEKYDQIFVEFHHHCVPRYSKTDTIRAAKKLASFGFNSFTLDKHNYLFYRHHA